MTTEYTEFIMDVPSTPDAPAHGASSSDAGSVHLTYVGILLVVIIGLLAVLWSRERRLRSAAEQNVVNLRHENQTLRQAMRTMGALRTAATQPSEQPD